MLSLGETDLATIYRHGRQTYPEECCGVMIGPPPEKGSEAVVVTRVLSAENEREDANRHNRFLISPRALLDAQRSARDGGLEILHHR